MNHEHLYSRTMVKQVIPSLWLGQERTATIYLPPGYNELLSYPVLYGQDGMELFNFGRAATIANSLILDEGLDPFLIVGIHNDPANRTAEYAPEGELFPSYLRFFAEELVPAIEASFPIRRDPLYRVLAGDSLGAAISLHAALEYPHLFRQVISLSGAFFETTQQRLIASTESDLSTLSVYQLVGLQETEVQTDRGTFDFLSANRITRELLERQKASLRYKESDGKHIWGFWQKELPEAMTYFMGKL